MRNPFSCGAGSFNPNLFSDIFEAFINFFRYFNRVLVYSARDNDFLSFCFSSLSKLSTIDD